MTDVVVDWDWADEQPLVCAKISDVAWELNIRAGRSEFDSLRHVRQADWNERRSLGLGSVAGSSAFWTYADGRVTVLIGHDDETWDVAIDFPVEVVDDLLAALTQLGS
jgi:hypothetical protein